MVSINSGLPRALTGHLTDYLGATYSRTCQLKRGPRRFKLRVAVPSAPFGFDNGGSKCVKQHIQMLHGTKVAYVINVRNQGDLYQGRGRSTRSPKPCCT